MKYWTDGMIATTEFIQLLTSHQSRLYAFILTLVFDPDQADDVLQQTNAVLWQKNQEFEVGSNFVAWSFRVARFQVLAHRKTIQRDRLVFDDELIREVAWAAEECDATYLRRQRLLRNCMEKLSEQQRSLLRSRYSNGASIATVADSLGKSAGAVKQLLFRVRGILVDCVNSKIAQEADG